MKPTEPLNSPEVLIIEEVTEDQEALSDIFECSGFRVLFPPDSDPARYFVHRPVDLLVLNLHYKNLDPYPLIALSRKKKIPCIVVSRSFHQEEARTACQLGAKMVWDLPLDRVGFRSAVQKYFPQAGAPSRTILIIDDVAETRSYFAQTLSGENFSVLEASTGKEGWSLLKNHPVDLCLLDIGLPDMDGKELLKQIRNTPETETLPVLLCTVRGTEETLPPEEEYLQKPFSPQQLLDRISLFFPLPTRNL